MSRLIELYENAGQSPWLDNLKREWLQSGEIARWVDRGVRGITSNPSIFQKAIESSEAYDEQFRSLIESGRSVEEAYWELVISDIEEALAVLRPVFDSSDGVDGFVSVEVAPSLANDTDGTASAARDLSNRIAAPNLFVKIPATVPGLDAIRTMISEGRSINVTLIFSLDRYRGVMEAYVAGLEDRVAAGVEDLSGVSSVASFFISRVDTEVDARLDSVGTPAAAQLKGRAAVAQAQLAYDAFEETFAGPRWDALAARGARPQRPLWASTSTKNPSYPDTLYVDSLIGPDSVNTLPDPTLVAFEDHGTVRRTIDENVDKARQDWSELGDIVDLDDVAEVLEKQGVAAFASAFDELLSVLESSAQRLSA